MEREDVIEDQSPLTAGVGDNGLKILSALTKIKSIQDIHCAEMHGVKIGLLDRELPRANFVVQDTFPYTKEYSINVNVFCFG